MIVDAGGINAGEDRTLLGAEVFVPGLKLIGGFDGAASLAAPGPVKLEGSFDDSDYGNSPPRVSRRPPTPRTHPSTPS